MNVKEKKLHPALLLFILTIIIMIVSSVGSILNLETTYYNVNAVTGELIELVYNIWLVICYLILLILLRLVH